MRHAACFAIIGLGAALATGCGSKPAPVAAPQVAEVDRPARPSGPATPNGPEAQKAAVEHAIAYAQTKYSGKLRFSDPVSVFVPAPAGNAPSPQQMPRGFTGNPSLAPSPPPTAAELESMGLKAPAGSKPATSSTPDSGLAPPTTGQLPRSDPNSHWKVMFRLIAPVKSDPETPPVTTRVFAVYASGKVVEQEPLTVPVDAYLGGRPPTP